MANISQNVNIEMLEKLPNGTYKRKYPKTRADDGTTFDQHLADYKTHTNTNATTSKKGHVQVGSNVNVSNGVISVPNASTSARGAVQLSTSTTSTSTTLAATPSAVRLAMNRANEAFTSASNGKQLVGNAITGVDDSVVIPTNPTFEDLASAIGGISTGAKRAEGSGRIEQNVALEVTGLGFKPAVVVIKWKYGVGVSTLMYKSDRNWAYEGSTNSANSSLRVRDILDDGFVVRKYNTDYYELFDWIAYDE